ncbi:MAG TPA: RNA polymerase sigma-70 factor [Puia sp.]|nr:RNA polymerase sigma-70 factor [Puia sp.]
MPPYEEKLLLEEVSRGSERAFRVIYDAYFGRLSAYIFKLCKSPVVAEEIIQEVFLKIWLNRAALAEVESPEAYILSIARHKVIDHLRRLAKETRLIAYLSEQLQSGGISPEHLMDAKDMEALIAAALGELSPQKGKIFRMSKQEGLDHDEISRVMQLSRSTVKNHLSETLRHIRRHITLPGVKKI